MKAVKTHVGRCDSCGEPAAYKQILPGGRQFLFCEQHVPLNVKKQANAAEAANKGKK
jgi:ssDNA-binding Zn-finger/Zn-ribbon topoisomerase 1